MRTHPVVALALLALLVSPASVVAEAEDAARGEDVARGEDAARGEDVARDEDVAKGEDVASQPEAPAPPSAAPLLDLDRLLRPRGAPPSRPAGYGARNQQEWSDAFEHARLEVAVLETRIEVAQEKLRKASSGNWSYSPMGGGPPTDPEVLRLRAELRRDRQSLETARRRLRDLDVEASLAGVPESWREAPQEP